MSQIAVVLARMTTDYASKFVKAGKVLAQHPYRELNDAYTKFSDEIAAIIEDRQGQLLRSQSDLKAEGDR